MRRRFRRRPPLALLALVGLALLVTARIGWDWLAHRLASGDRVAAATGQRSAAVFQAGACTIVRVLRGDRLLVRQMRTLPNQAEPQAIEGEIRLLGIEIPPSASRLATDIASPSAAARRYAEEFVRGGKVALELDKRRLDADGCFLAYVVVDGQMLNVELVRQGLARVDSHPGDSATILRLLRRAEDEARLAGRGVWGKAVASREDATTNQNE